MVYFDVCREIWTKWVPQRGQSTVLQGELLRQIEKLRHEAKSNENRDWCRDHAYFCGVLDLVLGDDGCLTDEEWADVHGALVRMRSAGEVAWRFYRGDLTEEELDEDFNGELAYTEDDLYDLVCSAVAKFYQAHPEPIPHRPRPAIRH